MTIGSTRIPGCILAFVFMLTTSLPLDATPLAETRTWTSQNGRTIQAKLIDAQHDIKTVKLKRIDGRIFNLDWDQLNDADQALLLAHCIEKTPSQAAGPIVEIEPATFTGEELPKKLKLRRVPMVVQKHNYCVPASASMIAGYHGVKANQDEIAKLSSKGSEENEGTYPSEMVSAMEKLGFTGRLSYWQEKDEFFDRVLPAIRANLLKTGPIYISFKPGAFGSFGHGCVIVGYDDRKQVMLFFNPWGNEFEEDYTQVARLAEGVAFIEPPKQSSTASDEFILSIQQAIPKMPEGLNQIINSLKKSKIKHELTWCSRYDELSNQKFADDTARKDGRKILKFAFERAAAAIIPFSPQGHTKKYFLVTRPPKGGARFAIRALDSKGWSEPKLQSLGSLTREWPTEFKKDEIDSLGTNKIKDVLNLIDSNQSIWQLPMIELRNE